ncbi:hypothetical protein FXW07_16540 [Methanosarcina sp. DH1]|uniref:ABC-three component system middle component 6 n=1 Tax=Methanosarcina sp. DH1 TaxID=2605695 RepID=UPI001E554DC1|nr:ABC-three component system middle component 6 [Methanosarcina sp. DH1]MCC4768161.1 hypothetical protein [Methanosarcina sp. DH1]
MILPNKNVTLRYSLLGTGSKVISELKSPQTVTSLWDKVRNYEEVSTFEKYILCLDFLYTIGIIELEKGLIKKVLK